MDFTLPEKIEAGQRVEILTREAAWLRRDLGLNAVEITAGLRAINERRCIPPLPDEEVVRIAQSVARYTP